MIKKILSLFLLVITGLSLSAQLEMINYGTPNNFEVATDLVMMPDGSKVIVGYKYTAQTNAAVIAELTANGTQATAVAASSNGIISYVSTEVPAAYLATGELPTAYVGGTSQWALLLGAKDTTDRPIYNAIQPMNAAGQVAPRSLRGNVLGLDFYVGLNNITSTKYYTMVFVNQLIDAYIPGPRNINFYAGINLKYHIK